MTARALDVFTCPLDGISLIEASAGTGKTWNICGLYLRLLLERRLEVQQILVVTFTKAATAELRDRIRTRIAETLARLRGGPAPRGDTFVDDLLRSLRETHGLADDDLTSRLDLALQTFDEAAIFTIHGFSQRALADTPFTSGVPMTLELLADDSDLRMEVVHDFWRQHVAGDALSPGLAAHLLARKDSPTAWALHLKRVLAKPLSRVLWPDRSDAAVDTGDLAAAHATARATWRAQREAIVACVTEALPRLSAVSYKPAAVALAAEHWDRQLASTDPLAAPHDLDKLALFSSTKLQPRKGLAPPRRHDFFDQADALLRGLEATRQALALVRHGLLRRLLADAPARLRALKRDRRVVAFDDMLFNLHQGLAEAPGLGLALRERYPAALIDEFQDTDPLQFAIFKAIYAGGTSPLFLIGDPKQAIYSFRNADLHTYLQARGDAAAAYTLTDNQRSTRELLAGLNGLFTRNDQAFVLPGLAYQPVACGAKPRKPWHDATEPRAPLQLWALPSGADGLPLRKTEARRAAVAATAGEIARLLSGAARGDVQHDGRPLSGGDIAVLVRSHAQGAEMRRALAALGVGSVELSQASVFQSSDAEDLARVLAAVLEPARDRLLRTALATDMLGFDASAIDAISADETRLLGVVERFLDYRDLWLRRGVGVMLRSLATHEGVEQRLLSRADGERRLTNLRHLAESLHEASGLQGSPELLLRWLRAMRIDPGNDESAQLRLESDRNLVQILTIHKSKGLEYPVVFCPFLWDGHPGGTPGAIEGRHYHADDGASVLDYRGDDAATDAIRQRIAHERDAENLRLIYVALTRAVQRCCLVVGSYAGARGSTVESARSRLNSLVAGAGMAPQAWRQHKLTPADIAAAWRAFAAAHPGCVALDALPAGPWTAVAPVRRHADSLAALPPPAHIPAAWWTGSYSSLTLGARHEAAAVDHDARIESPDAAVDGATIDADASDDILDFPRGPDAGNCVHAVFERVDFGDPATWPEAIDAALRDQPPRGVAASRLPRMLGRMLRDVLATPLPCGTALRDVPRERCLVELEFDIPALHVTAAALTSLLQAHGYPVPPLGFVLLEGDLRGFIDLVFEHDGRFHILDWKSNHLGRAPADYAAAPVARAMADHGYHLQYLLYTVALHRYLRRRLSGYDYDRHVGGATYLFVRGVRPGWADADGRPTGIHTDRPPRALVEALSALFATQSAREPA